MLLSLTIATLALAVGAALALHTGLKWMTWVRMLSGAAVALVVFLHLLPEAWELSGLYGALWAGIGFLLPQVAHRALHADHDHRAALSIAWLGLFVHAAGDGIGIAMFAGEATHHHAHRHDDVLFVLALHRLPVAAFLAAEVHRRSTKARAWAAVGALGLATWFGAASVSWIPPHSVEAILGPVTGLTTGLLLHIVAHRHHPDHEPGPRAP